MFQVQQEFQALLITLITQCVTRLILLAIVSKMEICSDINELLKSSSKNQFQLESAGMNKVVSIFYLIMISNRSTSSSSKNCIQSVKFNPKLQVKCSNVPFNFM